MKILLSAAIVALANIAVLPDAIETSSDNDKTLIIEHKLSLIDEQIDDEQIDDEQIDDEQYEQSEQAANARHANQFIKNNRSDGL